MKMRDSPVIFKWCGCQWWT